MSSVKKGDRVRLVEVEVIATNSPFHWVTVQFPSGHKASVDVSDIAEVIEPEYIPGEVYESPNGKKYLRLKGPSMPWRPLISTFRSCDVGEAYPERPLKRLVPEK